MTPRTRETSISFLNRTQLLDTLPVQLLHNQELLTAKPSRTSGLRMARPSNNNQDLAQVPHTMPRRNPLWVLRSTPIWQDWPLR